MRQPRGDRRTLGRLRLQARDEELLRALARLRVARTSDLATLCFPGVRRDTTQRRLRVLFDAAYLDVSSRDQASENLYSLGSRGRAFVKEVGEAGLPIPRGGLAHHLGIVGTWVALASSGHPGLHLELSRPDWELRAEFAARGLAVIPDLFAVLRLGSVTKTLAVEVDLGTEPVRVLRSKMRAYERLQRGAQGLFGSRRFVVAVVLGDDRRREAVEQLVRRDWDGEWAIWTLTEGPASAIGSLFGLPGDPLATSPCGKGRRMVASDDAASGSREGRGGLSGV